MKIWNRAFYGAFAGWIGAAGILNAAELNIQAAASLRDVLREVGVPYEKQSGDRLFFNFGSSNTLARQIKEGAPADLFFSADEMTMDVLEKEGLLVKGTRKSLLLNSLVIVVEIGSTSGIKSAEDLTNPDIKRIALGDPRLVPAGIYARAYLQKKGLWAKMSNKVIPTENVRAALATVESGDVEAGIVYKTDALGSKKVKIAFEVSVGESPRISYPVALLKDSTQPAQTKKFIAYLESQAAQKVFRRHGFIVLQ